jgi:hypothetical protein
VNKAMGAVEGQGLPVNGHSADLGTKQIFRGTRATGSGELLLGTTQAGDLTVPTLYGVPIGYTSFPIVDGTHADFFTGDWNALIVGVRQDIRYSMDPSAVIADATGKVIISGFQDNQTPLKVWARFACVIVKPVTIRVPAGANPFAKAALVAKVTPAMADEQSADEGQSRSARK